MAPTLHHPDEDEFNDTVLTLYERAMEAASEGAADETEGWCPHVRERAVFSAVTMLVGRLYGDAMVHGVRPESLDASLRQFMRLGRAQALDEHREGGCAGCPASAALERMVELRDVC